MPWDKAAFYLTHQRLLNQTLNSGEQFNLIGTDQRDSFPLQTGPTGTADTVHIIFGNFRQVKVDHMGQFIDVESAGRDVGGNQYAGFIGFKVVKRVAAQTLAFVAVDRDRSYISTFEMPYQLIGTILGPGKDQHL